jgi:hypothetical protein
MLRQVHRCGLSETILEEEKKESGEFAPVTRRFPRRVVLPHGETFV